jgi:hypothetical protein
MAVSSRRSPLLRILVLLYFRGARSCGAGFYNVGVSCAAGYVISCGGTGCSNQHCYKFIQDQPGSWSEARAVCQATDVGRATDLAIVDSENGKAYM